MVKPENFGHLHLVHHLTVPLILIDLQKAFDTIDHEILI